MTRFATRLAAGVGACPGGISVRGVHGCVRGGSVGVCPGVGRAGVGGHEEAGEEGEGEVEDAAGDCHCGGGGGVGERRRRERERRVRQGGR